jgi:hypothetical protein
VTLLVALLLAADPVSARQVTVPLDEFERLRKLEERPSLTVVDHLQLEGSFAQRDLAVAFTGRASGTWPTVAVLSAEGARLHSCQGDALLSRGDDGGFSLTPLAARFTVRCKVALDGSDRMEARATPAVLEVDAAVTDGELVAASEGGARSLTVVRRLAGGAQEALPPAVTGRYLVTLLPEEVRFTYRLEVRNPARGHRAFEVALREAEHVESVNAPIAWDARGGRYAFDLPPGETVLTFTGRLSDPTFRPPVAANLQYLLLESHPLIRPDLRTGAKRVGLAETGLNARFRGAQAFLLDGTAEVAWTATRLEATKTAGLAVNTLTQVFFLGADGKARGEATLGIDNQGAAALTLAGAAQPRFASVGGEPAFLTHEAAGALFLPLAQGPQEVVVQDEQPFDHRLGLGWARLALPQVPVPASEAHLQLRYPAEWIPVYEELAPHARWNLPGLGTWLALALVLVAAERLLLLAGIARGRRWLLAGALTLAAAFSGEAVRLVLLAVLAPLAALAATLLLRRTSGVARHVAGAAVAVGGLALVVALASIEPRTAAPEREAPGDGTPRPAGVPGVAPPPSPERRSREEPSEAEDALAADRTVAGRVVARADYEGLPAHLVIPAGVRQTDFHRELLATDTARPTLVVVVSTTLLGALAGAALALLALALLLLRRDLAAGARTYAARFRAAG